MKNFRIVKFLMFLVLMFFTRGFAKGDVMENKNLQDQIIKTAEDSHWSRIYTESKANPDNFMYMNYGTKDNHLIFRNSKAQLTEPRILISPNGKFAAFWKNENYAQYNLELIDLNTYKMKNILSLKKACCVSWSPDSRKIAFLSIKNEADIKMPEFVLNVIDINSLSISKISTSNIDFITEQAWSRDGSKIVYSFENKISLYDFNTNKTVPLTDGAWASWSPIGDAILFFNSQNNYLNLLKIEGDNFKTEQLLSAKELGEGSLTFPFYWFPNGKYVFIGHLSPQETEIGFPYVLNIETHEVEKLSDYSWYFSTWGSGSN